MVTIVVAAVVLHVALLFAFVFRPRQARTLMLSLLFVQVAGLTPTLIFQQSLVPAIGSISLAVLIWATTISFSDFFIKAKHGVRIAIIASCMALSTILAGSVSDWLGHAGWPFVFGFIAPHIAGATSPGSEIVVTVAAGGGEGGTVYVLSWAFLALALLAYVSLKPQHQSNGVPGSA